MKSAMLMAVVFGALACSPPKTPAVCKRNLRDCFAAYDNNHEYQREQSRENWSALCMQDLGVCKRGYGQ